VGAVLRKQPAFLRSWRRRSGGREGKARRRLTDFDEALEVGESSHKMPLFYFLPPPPRFYFLSGRAKATKIPPVLIAPPPFN
jgi:hypothetical protein